MCWAVGLSSRVQVEHVCLRFPNILAADIPYRCDSRPGRQYQIIPRNGGEPTAGILHDCVLAAACPLLREGIPSQACAVPPASPVLASLVVHRHNELVLPAAQPTSRVTASFTLCQTQLHTLCLVRIYEQLPADAPSTTNNSICQHYPLHGHKLQYVHHHTDSACHSPCSADAHALTPWDTGYITNATSDAPAFPPAPLPPSPSPSPSPDAPPYDPGRQMCL